MSRGVVVLATVKCRAQILFLLSLSLLLALGGWQLHRGLEKAAVVKLLERADQPQNYITLTRAAPNWNDLAYRRVRLQGEWRAQHFFLLANRVHRAQLGFEVLTPFQLTDGTMMLINRGWVADADNIAPVTARTTLTGKIYLPQKGFTLGAAYTNPTSPTVIQYFDAAQLASALGAPLQPAVLTLDADQPDALLNIRQTQTLSPARHFGYAVQWWALAVTLLVFGVIWQRRARQSK